MWEGLESALGAEAGRQPVKHLWISCQVSSSFAVLTSSLECFGAALRQVWLSQVFIAARDLVWQVFVKQLTRNRVIGPPSNNCALHSSEGCETGSAITVPSSLAPIDSCVLKGREELVTPVGVSVHTHPACGYSPGHGDLKLHPKRPKWMVL